MERVHGVPHEEASGHVAFRLWKSLQFTVISRFSGPRALLGSFAFRRKKADKKRPLDRLNNKNLFENSSQGGQRKQAVFIQNADPAAAHFYQP